MSEQLQKQPFLKRLVHDLAVTAKLIPYLGHTKPLLFLSIFLGLISSVVETISVGVVMYFIFSSLSDTVAMPENALAANFFKLIEYTTANNPYAIGGVILCAMLLKSFIRGMSNLLETYLNNNIHHNIRTALFEKYLMLHYTDFIKKDFGQMTNTLHVESWYVPEVIKSVINMTICLLSLGVYLGIIMILSWQIGLLVIFLGLLMRFLMRSLKEPIRNLGFETTGMHEEMAQRVNSRINAFKTIRAHGLEGREAGIFQDLSKRVSKAFVRMSIVDTYLKPVYEISTLLVIGILIWVSYSLGHAPTLTATIIALLYKVQPYFYGFESAMMSLMKSEGPVQAVMKQLEGTDLRDEDIGDIPLNKNWQKLRFENVSFKYEDTDVVRSLSFELERGKTLAITGPSGIGKSTLINLFLRLTNPSSGQIYLDEDKFNEVNRVQWQANIAAAGQDFELLEGTLRENLLMGRNMTEEQLNKALEVAEIKEYTDSLEEGLETKVGERGVRLSGGQRQRIVLARALAFEPDLLIMDEATSEVSMPVEKSIYDNIKQAYPDLTILLITHRDLPKEFIDVTVSL